MSFRVTLCSLLLVLALSGSVTLMSGLSVTWTVTSPTITFTITASGSLASSYDYWGVGFKKSSDRSDMIDSELWIITKSGTFMANWSTANSAPSSSKAGSAALKSFTSTNGGYVAVVTRSLATSNVYDFQLAEGSTYLLTYGYGLMSSGRLLSHSSRESGSAKITIEKTATSSGTGTSTTGSSGTSTTGSSGTSTTGSSGTSTGSSGTSTTGSNGTSTTGGTTSATDSGFETSESAPSSSGAANLGVFTLYLFWLA